MRLKRKSSRAPWHDYRRPGIYMITINALTGAPLLSDIAGDPGLPSGTPGAAHTIPTAVGNLVIKAIYDTFPAYGPIRVLQYSIMPDHLHLILHVKRHLDLHLGDYIGHIKLLCNNQQPLLEENYNDQILTPDRDLNTLFNYVRDNPRRLALRRANPSLFSTIENVTIDGITCRCYGNRFLLNHPFKEQVVVHRADTLQTRDHNRSRWMHTAANGGTLVSPFISRDERDILTMGIEAGANIIYITDTLPGEREKPTGRLFDLCAQGRLLLVAPPLPLMTTITRQACLEMNRLAAAIAANTR